MTALKSGRLHPLQVAQMGVIISTVPDDLDSQGSSSSPCLIIHLKVMVLPASPTKFPGLILLNQEHTVLMSPWHSEAIPLLPRGVKVHEQAPVRSEP